MFMPPSPHSLSLLNQHWSYINAVFFMSVLGDLFLFFETGFHYVALAGLEFTL